MSAPGPDGKDYEISPHWLWATPLALGLAVLVVTALIVKGRYASLDDALRTTGKVVALRERWLNTREDGLVKYYCPQVAFETARGQPVQFVGEACSTQRSPAVGAEVKVYYRPDAPEQAIVGGFVGTWGTPLIWGGLGLLCTALGLWLAARAMSAKRRPSRRGRRQRKPNGR